MELLVASVVAASAGALLIGALVSSNRSTEYRILQTLSTQLLASRLALLDDPLTVQTAGSGTVPAPFQEAAWTINWVEQPLEPLAEATLSLTYEGHTAHVVTYRRLVQP